MNFELILLMQQNYTDEDLRMMGYSQATIWRYRTQFYPEAVQKMHEKVRFLSKFAINPKK